MKFQNAWISDRTLCYLASGKPVVVQNTGPSSFLPNGEGMFRFATMEEAVDALAAVEVDRSLERPGRGLPAQFLRVSLFPGEGQRIVRRATAQQPNNGNCNG